MKIAMEVLEPELVKAGVQPTGKPLIGTVRGDLHDIGKNLVATMLKGAGFEVIDLDVNVSPEKSAAEAKVMVGGRYGQEPRRVIPEARDS